MSRVGLLCLVEQTLLDEHVHNVAALGLIQDIIVSDEQSLRKVNDSNEGVIWNDRCLRFLWVVLVKLVDEIFDRLHRIKYFLKVHRVPISHGKVVLYEFDKKLEELWSLRETHLLAVVNLTEKFLQEEDWRGLGKWARLDVETKEFDRTFELAPLCR